MMTPDIREQLRELIFEAISESFEVMKVARCDGPAIAAVRSEIIRTRDKIINHPAYERMVEELEQLMTMQVGCVKDAMFEAKQRAERSKALYEEEREKTRLELERVKSEFAALDPVTKRMQVWAATIDKVLPFKVEDGRLTVYGTEQVIRSRGLVMAALAGMTSVGVPPKQEDAQ